MAERAHRFNRQFEEQTGAASFARRFVEVHGDQVLYGPFAGLRIDSESSNAVAKLLGTYEQELAPTWERAFARAPQQFIDIGAADGYYAGGVAFRLADVAVQAYEPSRSARMKCAETAARNGVKDRIYLHGAATPRALPAAIRTDPLILCDCEGAEMDLLSEGLPASAARADLIIEVHESRRPGVRERLRQRFDKTHDLERIGVAPRDPDTFNELKAFSASERAAALDEMRGSQDIDWLVCFSRSRSDQPKGH